MEDVRDVERRAARGREELVGFVAAVVEAGHGPQPVHAVQASESFDQLGAIQTKFWSTFEEHVDSEDDDDLSTPEFTQRAQDAGFSVDKLLRADRALASGNDPCSADIKLTCSILFKMVSRNVSSGVPWQGPLPSPRISPPRTLGDCLAKVSYQNSPRSSSAKLIAGANVVNPVSLARGKLASGMLMGK